jgi:hypothetical protein
MPQTDNNIAIDIPEITLAYNRGDRHKTDLLALSKGNVEIIIRKLFPADELELQEHIIVLYLNKKKEAIGYYKHSKGGIDSTIVDVRIILAAALKSLATGIIVAHNHPSGNLAASRADMKIGEEMGQATKLINIELVDFVIISKYGIKSFADDGLLGLEGLPEHHDAGKGFSDKVALDLAEKIKHNKRSLEKLAAGFGITDKTLVKELTELAIVNRARTLAHAPGSIRERFNSIVELYQLQVNLSHRTSQSILLQQYSTPAPIGYLTGVFCGVDQFDNTKLAFEPSAGNGLLTIAGNASSFIVNEIDATRNRNLHSQPFLKITRQDATKAFKEYEKQFYAVITNPPFGKLEIDENIDDFRIKSLEQLMAIRALDTLRNDGKAAIIIGGHTNWDAEGRIQAGKNRIFFNYLYSRYAVKAVLNIAGDKLYSRQGTSFDVRLILIDGRKQQPQGTAPLFNPHTDRVVQTFDELFIRVTEAMNRTTIHTATQDRLARLRNQSAGLLKALKNDAEELGAPYQPASAACVVLNTQVPDSMAFETQSALAIIRQEIGGSIDNFVRHRLQFPSKAAMCNALSAEQIDAVAMAIYNMEAREQGMIIGDQTGIGKGRIAASIIRYACLKGKQPVFLTEKPNLFSDIYRDLNAIGSGHLRPFIVNSRESKTDIKDEDGNIIYQAPPVTEQESIFTSRELPSRYDFVLATYTQFNSPDKKPTKPNFLYTIAADNIFIMDEAHNASGASNTGNFLQSVIAQTKGVVFLSATFAKRPDNMPIYAMKTAISDCNMSRDELVEAITYGGVALQEVLSSQLVAEGQMIRRERSFEDIEVNYLTLDDKAAEHKAIADNITEILRGIIAFQTAYVNKEVKALDKIAAAESKEVELRQGTSQAGVDNMPYFSKIFQVINQMLFSLKAEAVALRAIQRLKEGKKSIIAFASTMGSFIETMGAETGLSVEEGLVINADFSEVLRRGLEGVLRYTEKDITGNSIHKKFNLLDFPQEAQAEYMRLEQRIKAVSTGITISPIDVIIRIIEEAGYSVAEVTGRKLAVQINPKTNKGLVMSRKRVNTNDAFRQFNNNEVDVLLINQSGSTGASAHAIPTAKVPADKVKQRVMIVLQAELNINTEVQKRGRINRTGQVKLPIYDYMTSAIPAEKRLMMMLQKKLKSLDANTTSNQKQSTKILDVPDFLNKYGDKVVLDYLAENPAINALLDDPLHLMTAPKEGQDNENLEIKNSNEIPEDAAHRVSGRVAVLSTAMQEDFYNEITEAYNDYVDYLKQIGEYDLEVEAMNLQTEAIRTATLIVGKGGGSSFGNDSVLETVRANVLKKPFSRAELENLVKSSLNGKDAKVQQQEIGDTYQGFANGLFTTAQLEINKKYDFLISEIPNEKALKKLTGAAQTDAILERETQLNEARQQALVNQQRKFEQRNEFLVKIFRFFYTGRKVSYALQSFSGDSTIPAVFLGFAIDPKKKNAYAPSAVKLRFALASSNKYLAIPASNSQNILACIGTSVGIHQPEMPELMKEWETLIAEKNVDRHIRHIVTGNLLQAFAGNKGKLVSYTTMSGEVKKGILLPENWVLSEQQHNNVSVPILKALPVIKSLVQNGHITTTNGISFFRTADHFKIILSAARSKGGDVYLDREVLALVENNNFEKTSDKMTALLPIKNIDALLEVLQRNHSCSVLLDASRSQLINREAIVPVARKAIELPPEYKEETVNVNVLKLKAKALQLKLKLLNAA